MIVIDSLNYIVLNVSSLDSSVKFYKDTFDFEVADKSDDQALLSIGDLIICLKEIKGFKSVATDDVKLSFFVDEEDFEDALDEINDSDIEIVTGPEKLKKGEMVVITDPDGNKIELRYPKSI